MKTNKIPKIIIIVCIPVIAYFLAMILWGDKGNYHKPYTHKEIVNILDPPLDTTKPLNEALFDKYHYTYSIHDKAIVLGEEVLEDMEFEMYGKEKLFVFTLGNDPETEKFKKPILIVEEENKGAFINAISRGDTLLFRKSGKIAWSFYKIK